MFRHFLQTWSIVPRIDRKRKIYGFWFGASLIFAGIYGIEVWQKAFSSEFVVSDDARQHVFWMQRFIEPELFPHDLIADYFQSVAPLGYTQFYQLFASFGIDPLLLCKLIPPILGAIATCCCFFLCLEIFPIPAAGFLASMLFTQNLWMRDDLASGTPRAFLNPLFLIFLYYFIRRSRWCFVMLVGIGLFYPQYVLVSAGLFLLKPLTLDRNKFKLSRDGREYWFCLFGLCVSFLVLLPYAITTSEFEPIVTAVQAKMMPEFLPGGRVKFFDDDFGKYWLNGGRSGIQIPFDPPLLAAGLLLPLLLQFPTRFPLTSQVRSSVTILSDLTLVSLGLFIISHALLFNLHLPSRYTQHSLRVVMSLAAAISLITLLDAVFRWIGTRAQRWWPIGANLLSLIVVTLLFGYLIIYPISLSNFPKTNYHFGARPDLYQFFDRQPKDIIIASISSEINNIPTFAHRSIISGQEYAIPYHLGYYRRFQTRTVELIQAQYAENLSELQNFIQKYDVDFWLLESDTLTPEYIDTNAWMQQYPQATQIALEQLKSGRILAFQSILDRCRTLQIDGLTVLPTECIAHASHWSLEETSLENQRDRLERTTQAEAPRFWGNRHW